MKKFKIRNIFKINYNQLLFTFVGFIIGIILTGLFLYQFISSQKNQGYNNGYLDGGFYIMHSINKNLNNKNIELKTKDTGKGFGFKYVGIEIVEINGIETVVFKGLDY